MQLLLTWPDNKHTFFFNESYSLERPAVFDISLGEFGAVAEVDKGNGVFFYWTPIGPVIFNACREYVCCVDGMFLHYGKSHPLHLSSEIQLGHFKVKIATDEQSGSPVDALHSLLSSSGMEHESYYSSEIEDILSHGGHHEADIRYSNEKDVMREVEGDVLKELAFEYKKFLIWGEQHREFFSHERQKDNKLPQDDRYFETVRDHMKDKTLTECILESSFLFEKVWGELDIINFDDDVLYEDEKHDILKALAPDNIASKNKKTVPPLVFEDLYKIGLDSHF